MENQKWTPKTTPIDWAALAEDAKARWLEAALALGSYIVFCQQNPGVRDMKTYCDLEREAQRSHTLWLDAKRNIE